MTAMRSVGHVSTPVLPGGRPKAVLVDEVCEVRSPAIQVDDPAGPSRDGLVTPSGSGPENRLASDQGAAVSSAATMARATKRVLLVDSVVWPHGLEPDPRRDVCGWFRRWTPPSSPVEWTRVGVETDINAAQSPGAWDGVILSGSPRDAWTDDPVNLQLGEWILRCRDGGVPVLGVCYGHQLMGRVLGARVAPHPEGLELGNTPVTLTPAGRASRLFEGLPDHFDVLSSHSDVVSDLPSGLSHTVAGSFAAIQGMQDSTGLLHGVQFHPETDPETLRLIWNPRRDLWRPRVRFDLDAVLDHLKPTPSGPRILHNFLQHFVRG